MKTSCFTILLFLSLAATAQDGPLQKGQIKLNVGLGVGSYIKAAGGSTAFPPLTVSAEYAIDENITVGGLIGYTSTEDTYSYSSFGSKDTYKISNTLIGARVNYYLDVNPKYDVYAGALLGYNAVSSNFSSSSSEYQEILGDVNLSASSVLYGVHAGGRYNFSPATSAFAEIGYGIAVLNLGITLNLGKK
ncbi:MAG: outer membrane beta-barrel protein [Segetibacter sp.]